LGWTFYNSNGQRLNTSTTLIDNLDIDGATDIGADIVDADLFIIDDGAGGTNRKTAASRIKTYIGTSPVVREGGQTSEGTTTSTSSATVITAASLTAQAAEPVQIFYDVRKTTGGAYSMASGLTLNSTSVRSVVALTNASNRAEDAGHTWMIPPRVTNYLGGGIGAFGGYLTLTPAVRAYDATAPNAEITDVLVLGSVQNAAITAGADELHVYSMATS
jgi:hypothetical protein